MASVGLAVAFTLKEYGSSLATGLITVLGNAYQPGDWIVDDAYGEVKLIGARVVVKFAGPAAASPRSSSPRRTAASLAAGEQGPRLRVTRKLDHYRGVGHAVPPEGLCQ